ncbi:MAG TPA: hypothetical protein VJ740_14705 [Hyphomicrobiaceae bacterium]|jgi:hypothetical protein|nr:hypothetical protein [Hyphomicrobiaceae bacterium]
MKKHLLLVAAALAASAPILVQPEPAEAGFLRRALFGHRHGVLRHRHHHFHLRRRVIIAPVIVAPAVTAPAMRAPARASKAAMPSAARNSDGSGRTFDPASMAWTDGNQCWSGAQRWSFRSGWWFYGSHRWYPVDGTWRTDAPDAPKVIDCQSVAAFARPVPTTTTAAPLSEETGRAEASNTPATECSKYSPSIGRVIRTACGG